jgi:oxygen-dependent protoporphyrinogen oxidase
MVGLRGRSALGKKAHITVLEGSDRLGGWLRTVHKDGYLFERGARSFRPSMGGVTVLKLVEELQLTSAAIAPPAAGKNRWIYLNGKLEPLPGDLKGFLMNDTVMKGVGDTAWDELFKPKTPWTANDFDESVYDFISRRFSPYVANTLIDPLAGGIFAGDIRKLSIKSAFGRLYDMEQEHGSVVRALLTARCVKTPPPSAHSYTLASSHPPAHPPTYPLIHSRLTCPLTCPCSAADEEGESAFVKDMKQHTSVTFERGMETLTDELARRLREDPDMVEIRTGAVVQRVWPHAPQGGGGGGGGGDGRVGLAVGGAEAEAGVDAEVMEFDHVFCTLPASAASTVMHASAEPPPQSPSPQSPPPQTAQLLGAAAQALGSIPYASVGVVNLGYDRDVLGGKWAGFGHLIPSGEGQRALGCVWDSCAFPQQPAGHTAHYGQRAEGSRLTVMAGGALQPELAELSEEELTVPLVPHGRPRSDLSLVSLAHARSRSASHPPALHSFHPRPHHTAHSTPHTPTLAHPHTRTPTHPPASHLLTFPPSPQELALDTVREHLGVVRAPAAIVSAVERDCIPQYNVGHSGKVAAAELALGKAFSGRLTLLGNSYHGVGVADTVADAKKAADALAEKSHQGGGGGGAGLTATATTVATTMAHVMASPEVAGGGGGRAGLADLRAMTVPELKQLCAQAGLAKAGKKQDLIDRLAQ